MRRHVVVATGCGDGTPREEAIEAVKFLIGRDCDGIVVLGHDLLDEDMQMLHKMHPKMAFLNRRSARWKPPRSARTTTTAANWRRAPARCGPSPAGGDFRPDRHLGQRGAPARLLR
jgi:hypothetical protein